MSLLTLPFRRPFKNVLQRWTNPNETFSARFQKGSFEGTKYDFSSLSPQNVVCCTPSSDAGKEENVSGNVSRIAPREEEENAKREEEAGKEKVESSSSFSVERVESSVVENNILLKGVSNSNNSSLLQNVTLATFLEGEEKEEGEEKRNLNQKEERKGNQGLETINFRQTHENVNGIERRINHGQSIINRFLNYEAISNQHFEEEERGKRQNARNKIRK